MEGHTKKARRRPQNGRKCLQSLVSVRVEGQQDPKSKHPLSKMSQGSEQAPCLRRGHTDGHGDRKEATPQAQGLGGLGGQQSPLTPNPH